MNYNSSISGLGHVKEHVIGFTFYFRIRPEQKMRDLKIRFWVGFEQNHRILEFTLIAIFSSLIS